MDDGRLRYLELFLDSVDYVESGRKGEISENRRLVSEYRPQYYSVIEPHLKNPNAGVRKETVLLLSKLGERRAMDRIKEMRISDNELVSGACLAYLRAMGDDDDAVEQLLDTMRHTNGREFTAAASKLRTIAKDADIPEIREIYGQVNDDLKEPVAAVLNSIIARYPELEPKRYLIMSEPVYPNEESLVRFLDKSIVYMDIRYRDTYADSTSISAEMYNKIVSAFRKIQIRLYNEKANLRYYSKETKQMYSETEDLLLWAIEDLSAKTIQGAEKEADSHHCPHCGAKMGRSISGWICPECGQKSA